MLVACRLAGLSALRAVRIITEADRRWDWGWPELRDIGLTGSDDSGSSGSGRKNRCGAGRDGSSPLDNLNGEVSRPGEGDARTGRT
jgi:hypothetical protein